MRRLLTLAATIALACAGLFATGPAAEAAEPVETFTNFDTGTCLTLIVTGRPPHLRHRARLDTCDGRAEQAWTEAAPLLDAAGNPTAFQLVSAAGECLVPVNNNVTYDECAPGPDGAPDRAKYWVKQKLGNGTVRLINLGTGLLLGRGNPEPTALTLYSQGLFAPSVMWKTAVTG